MGEVKVLEKLRVWWGHPSCHSCFLPDGSLIRPLCVRAMEPAANLAPEGGPQGQAWLTEGGVSPSSLLLGSQPIFLHICCWGN